MMSSRELRRRMHLPASDPQQIMITPLIDEKVQIGLGTVDLRLGREFETTVLSSHAYTSPVRDEPGKKNSRRAHRVYLTSLTEPYVIHPQEFVKAKTLEYVKLPNDVGGRLSGRSSWAREGLLVHCTADLIHPGSKNPIVLELRNIGSVPIELYAGLRVAQLTFAELDSVDEDNGGYSKMPLAKFNSAEIPYSGHLDLDPEADALRKAMDDELEQKSKLLID